MPVKLVECHTLTKTEYWEMCPCCLKYVRLVDSRCCNCGTALDHTPFIEATAKLNK